MNILSSKTPKARKQHRCDYCWSLIEIGEIYDNLSIENDGEVYTWKNHIDCQKIAEKLKMFEENQHEGVTESMFTECIVEEYYSLTEGTKTEKIPFKQKLEIVIKHHLTPCQKKQY